MTAWTYGDFPVEPDNSPLSGSGHVVQTLQANELREAALRRASLIGAVPPVPAEVADLEACYLSWLTEMRTAMESLVAEGQYGTFMREYIDPDWTPLTWTPWTKASLLEEIHSSWIDNALVTDSADWMQAADETAALDGRADMLGNPVLHVSGDPGEVLADYDLRGLNSAVNLDPDLKLYVSILDEGGGNYRIRFYRDAARNYQTAYTDPFPWDLAAGGPVSLPLNTVWGYVLWGSVSVTQEVTAPNTAIEIQVEFDRSIMYAAHINEIYYALELLAYIEVAPNFTAIPGYTDGASGYGDGAGLDPWDWLSMMEAYDEGWAMFDAGGYSPGGGSLYAEARSHLYWDEWANMHYYYVDDRRVYDVSLTLPTAAWPIIELAIPFWSMAADPFMNHWPEMFNCTMDGEPDWSRFGDVDDSGFGQSFTGWLVWPGEFGGETVSFDYSWPNIEAGMWGGPDLHEASLSVNIEGHRPIYGGFAFEDLDGQYRNFDWSPVWGISWPW